MKRFLRTLPGKVILFLGCLLAAALAAGCGLGAFMLVEGGFYVTPEDALLADELDYEVKEDLYDIANCWLVSGSDDYIQRQYGAERTNLRYRLLDGTGAVVCGNLSKTDAGAVEWSYDLYYQLTGVSDAVAADPAAEPPPASEPEPDAAEETAADADHDEAVEATTLEYDAADGYVVSEVEAETYYITESGAADSAAGGSRCRVQAYLAPGLPVADNYSFLSRAVHLAYSLRYAVYPIGLFCLLLSLGCFVALLSVSGRRPDSDEPYPGPLNGLPFDLLVLGGVLLILLAFRQVDACYSVNYYLCQLLRGLWLLLAAALALGLAMATACRARQQTLLTNTLIWRLRCFLGRLLRRLGEGIAALCGEFSVWGVAFLLAAVTLLEFVGIGISGDTHQVFLLWLIEKLILIPIILYLAVGMRRLQRGGQALAAGDLDYLVDTYRLIGPLRRHGENLNSIGDGINRAVMERLKSERLKTELITNVSHDIKTPLTSIINYADLIGREECDNERITAYSAVLLRQSERLKRLIEDLVEASKAQTGNLELTLSPCDVGVFLSQAGGEYEEKLQAAGLELIVNQPAKQVEIMADGRRLWRVFDNLMNNICKYSQSGTRVYLTLYEDKGRAVITFRNTSRDQLNLSPDELMERFVRGDASRATEGNGLGLSIAKSLTELQQGEFTIDIDGDLFKVTLAFPILSRGV